MKKAVGYIRVSTSEQARDGVSLEAQRARIEAHCKVVGLELVGVYADEGISGRSTANRPALDDALKAVSRIKGSLVVYSLSRLARSTPDAIRIADGLDKAGAQLVMLAEQVDTNTAAGRMFYTVLAALAAFESDQISERTALAVRWKKANGKRWCRDAPFGYAFADGRLTVNEGEQCILRRMRRLKRSGCSTREIAARLASQGIVNRAGRPFSFQAIACFLVRANPPTRTRAGEETRPRAPVTVEC